MGTGTLTSRSTGETITSGFFNDFNSALQETVVGRNSSGAATSGQALGSASIPWGSGYFNSLIIGGSALDTSQITSPANRIVSGATRTSSNQPNYLTANGSALSLTIDGATTNLVFDVNGAAVTCSTNITVSSLTAAPSSNNTALVNMSDAADQELTRYWGEQKNKFVTPQSKDAVADPLYETITVDAMGSEITGLVGNICAFKINDGSNDEYFLGYVKSTTEITQCFRGHFLDSSGVPVNRIKFANNDTITLMKLAWVFLTDDGTTADVTYTNPVWSFDQPGSPVTGDYWYDLSVSQWKRYSGSAFVSINRTLIGIAFSDATNCLGTRSMDFYSKYESTNTIGVERSSTTNCRASNLHGNLFVYSGNLDFKLYTPEWNITTDLASTVTKDAYLAETASTWYYLYLKDTGDRVISDIGPVKRDDILGDYHPHNPWRCCGLVFNNSSSDLEGAVTDGNDRIYPAVAIICDAKDTTVSSFGTTLSSSAWVNPQLNTLRGESWFVTLSGSGTTGPGGTKYRFTLQPGTYEMTGNIYFIGFSCHYGYAVFYDETNAALLGHSSSNIVGDDGSYTAVNITIEETLTIDSSTEFSVRARMSYIGGIARLGATSNISEDTNPYLSSVKIRKLK